MSVGEPMFKKIRQWREKRQERKVIQYGFRIARSVIPNVGQTTKYCYLKTLAQLLDTYCERWGNDNFSQFYWDRLNYLQMIPHNGLSV